MPLRRLSFRGLLPAASLALALFLSGCSSDPTTRAIFPVATINGKSARVALDTGSDISALTQSGAEKLDVRVPGNLPTALINGQQDENAVALSDPVPIRLGNLTFTTQLPIITSAAYKRQSIDPFSTDAFIGWLEMQGNVLFFDGANHTISNLPEAPADSRSWLHFALLPNSRLFFEVPEANGSIGVIFIDTGQPSGVSLPPNQWKAWLAAHPNASTVNRSYNFPGEPATVQSTPEAWADSITLGTLTLTDVPVHPAGRVETRGTQHYLGTFGLYALSRLNMIVDTNRHTIAIQPLPAPGAPYPGFSRPAGPAPAHDDWLVADNVQLSVDYFFFHAGMLQYQDGEYTYALVNLNHARDLNPHNVDALLGIILDQIALNNLTAAIEDCNTLLAVAPHYSPVLLQRALARQLRGDYLGALEDYNEVVVLLPPGGAPNAALNRHLLSLRLGMAAGHLDEDSVFFPDAWDKLVAHYLLGTFSESTLMAEGSSDSDPRHYAMALYFAGALHLLNGSPVSARVLWDKCVALPIKGFDQYQALARADLNRLDQPSTAP